MPMLGGRCCSVSFTTCWRGRHSIRITRTFEIASDQLAIRLKHEKRKLSKSWPDRSTYAESGRVLCSYSTHFRGDAKYWLNTTSRRIHLDKDSRIFPRRTAGKYRSNCAPPKA